MKEVSLSMGANIDQHDISQLSNILKHMKTGDKITIQLEAGDAHESGGITDALALYGFDYQPHGGNGTDFYFTAQKV